MLQRIKCRRNMKTETLVSWCWFCFFLLRQWNEYPRIHGRTDPMIYPGQTVLLAVWAFCDCTTSTYHRVISTPVHIKLATYALSAVRKSLAFPLVLGQPQHVGVVTELWLRCCCNILPYSRCILYTKKQGRICDSQSLQSCSASGTGERFPEAGGVREAE